MKFNSEKLEIKTFPAKKVPDGWSVLDIDPENAREIMGKFLSGAKTVFYNGAAGLWENPLFTAGTREIILELAKFKEINPETKIVVLGGDGSIAFMEELGEEKAKEVAYLISQMGGSAWKYLLGEPLSALDYIHRKDLYLQENEANGVIDYSNLAFIEDLPYWHWQSEFAQIDALVIADLNIGKTKNLTEKKLLKLQKIETIIEVIKYLKQKMGKRRKIIIISHNGRFKDYHKKLEVAPLDGTVDSDYSIKPIAWLLTVLLRKDGIFDETEEITFAPYSILSENPFEKPEIKKGNVILFENPRFWKDETSEDKNIALAHAKKIWRAINSVSNPTLCVQTALGALHRGDQASKGLIMQFVMGPRVISIPVKEELSKLYEVGAKPIRSILAIIQGSKLDKIEDVIKSLVEKKKVDGIFIGGKIAMPFVNKEPLILEIMELAKKNGIKIFLPEKVVAAKIPEGMTEEEFISTLKK